MYIIKKINGEMDISPSGIDVIEKGDSLIVIGEKEAMIKLEKATKK